MGETLFRQLTEREQFEGKRALQQLGSNVVDVELELDDVAIAVEDAKLWIAAKIGEVRRGKLTLNGTPEYTLPVDVDVLIEVIPPGNSFTEIDTLFSNGVYTRYPSQTYRRGGMQMTTQVQDQVYDLMRSRANNVDFSWDFDRRSRKLTIRPSTFTGICWYEYCVSSVDVERMQLRLLPLFRRHIVASLMRVLGRIRRKFTEIPMGGSKVGLDGDTLSSDAEMEFSLLDEEVAGYVDSPGFLIG